MPDFPTPEFKTRLANAQTLMREQNLDAMFFCTEPEVRYFTGFPHVILAESNPPLVFNSPRYRRYYRDYSAYRGGFNAHDLGARYSHLGFAQTHDDDGLSLLMDALNPYKIHRHAEDGRGQPTHAPP